MTNCIGTPDSFDSVSNVGMDMTFPFGQLIIRQPPGYLNSKVRETWQQSAGVGDPSSGNAQLFEDPGREKAQQGERL